jgi:arginyl-tRNA synthetase
LKILTNKIKKDLEILGINFDRWVSENDLYLNDKDKKLINFLEEKKLVYYLDGALFFKSSLAGDDKDRVIIKEDGEYTYFFSDILYHIDKMKRSNFLINIMGADHHGYISRLKGSCSLISGESKRMEFILVQMLSLLTDNGDKKKISKRLGNTIDLDEILGVSDINQLKFLLLEKESNQSLSLNLGKLKENQEKTPLYYIQYAHARCCQIVSKSLEKNLATVDFRTNLLKSEDEFAIMKMIFRFPSLLDDVISENKHHHLIHYLFDLSKKWQIYYQKNMVLDAEDKELSSQRLFLTKVIQIIISLGLNFMGIDAPKMIKKSDK